MAFSVETLKLVFKKTSGCCRFCGKRLAFANRGRGAGRGAWEVDHSVSRANGGGDHANNLFASCVACNIEKGRMNGKSYIAWRRANGLHVPDWSKEDWFWRWLFG